MVTTRWRHWLRAKFASSRRRRGAARPRLAYRPWLEYLEYRLAPTANWTGMGDGSSWTDAQNWDHVPGPGDDAVIGSDFAGSTIVHDGHGTDLRTSLNTLRCAG